MVASSAQEREVTSELQDEVVLPRRRYGQWVLSAVVFLLAAAFLWTIARNDNFHWDVVGQYLTAGTIMQGLVRTLWLTAIAMAVGIVLGVPLAVMRRSDNPLFSGLAFAYVWFFRGTPLLVQIIFWFNLAALFPKIAIGIPNGPKLIDVTTNDVLTPILAAILALGLNQAAYTAEIVRSGLLSVEHGQTEAAMALGMTKLQLLRRVVLPQALRVIVPPMGSETISMLKVTSLVSVISFSELLYAAQSIYAVNYQVIPLLLVASIWYLVVVSVLSVGQYYIERRLGRGYGSLALSAVRKQEA